MYTHTRLLRYWIRKKNGTNARKNLALTNSKRADERGTLASIRINIYTLGNNYFECINKIRTLVCSQHSKSIVFTVSWSCCMCACVCVAATTQPCCCCYLSSLAGWLCRQVRIVVQHFRIDIDFHSFWKRGVMLMLIWHIEFQASKLAYTLIGCAQHEKKKLQLNLGNGSGFFFSLLPISCQRFPTQIIIK